MVTAFIVQPVTNGITLGITLKFSAHSCKKRERERETTNYLPHWGEIRTEYVLRITSPFRDPIPNYLGKHLILYLPHARQEVGIGIKIL